MKILFWLYRSRVNNAGMAPVMMRITIAGQRVSFSTNLTVQLKQWDKDLQCFRRIFAQAKEYNLILESIKAKAWRAYSHLLSINDQVAPRLVVETMLGKNKSSVSLMEAITSHIDYLKSRQGIDIAFNTVKKYQTLAKKVDAFLHSRNYKDIKLANLKATFIHEFDTYMRSEQHLSQNGVAKNMQQLKRVIKVSIQKGWLTQDPFHTYSCPMRQPQRSCLTKSELQQLELHTFHCARLQKVADLFVFCCYTGLAYVDLVNLKCLNLETDPQGVTWIKIARRKTESLSIIPVLPEAQRILLKYTQTYSTENNIFPKMSNQNLNKYLKEIANLLLIKKRISMHVARHTFATSVTLERGVDITSVSRMLGHRDLRTTQLYAKITTTKIRNDMSPLLFPKRVETQ